MLITRPICVFPRSMIRTNWKLQGHRIHRIYRREKKEKTEILVLRKMNIFINIF